MYTLKVENTNGEILYLQPNPSYIIALIDGLNPPKANINGTSITNSDGQVLNQSRIDTRNIVITMYINEPVETNRINLYKFFRNKNLIKIYYENGTRKIMTEGYVETFEFDLFAARQAAQISIKCLDPYLKSAEEIYSEMSNTESLFEFPFDLSEMGQVMSEYSSQIETHIVSDGEVTTGCIIEIRANGAVTSPITIYESVENKIMKINADMQNGDLITINTNKGNKRISRTRGTVITNLINYLDDSSEWFNIRPGENVLTFSAGTNADLLEITIRHYDNYLGV